MATEPNAPSNFDMRQNVETWHAFNRLAKWIVGFCVLLLILMAMFLV
jgi:cell division protein FtsX